MTLLFILLFVHSKIVSANPGKVYTQWTSRAQKVWPDVLDRVLKVGQLQLIRKHIFYELRTGCKFDSKHLASTLETMNQLVYLFLCYSF